LRAAWEKKSVKPHVNSQGGRAGAHLSSQLLRKDKQGYNLDRPEHKCETMLKKRIKQGWGHA
jgi:hypothetical protein